MRSDSSIRRPIIRTHASGLLTIMVATLSSAACAQSQPREQPTMVVCAGGRNFQMEAREKLARIFLDGRQVRLTRRSLGQQYRSSDAALIIDGDYVAFVLNNDLAYEDCHIRAPH